MLDDEVVQVLPAHVLSRHVVKGEAAEVRKQQVRTVWCPAKQERQIVPHAGVGDSGGDHGAFVCGRRSALERYYEVLDRTRAGLREQFSKAELALLADVCNGTLWDPHTLALIGANVEDAEDSYFETWKVDRAALLKKLNGLSFAEHVALVDAIERFWQAAATGIPVDAGKLLA